MAVNVVELLEDLPSAQHGYFTRAQASAAGVEDYDLHRAEANGFIERVGHGTYRAVGAPTDRLGALRVAWLRLSPKATPRQRTINPAIWVSHESAASVHGFGVLLADTPTFTSSRRLQPPKTVKVHRRSGGLARSEWTVIDGFAVTQVHRTAADLLADGADGGHLGRFIGDALRSGATDPELVRGAMGIDEDEFAAVLSMSSERGGHQ